MDPRLAAGRFAVPGRLSVLEPLPGGNVNDSFLAVFDGRAGARRRIVLQRVNRKVFPEPRWIMSNLRVVLDHVQPRLRREAAGEDRAWVLPRIVACRDGRDWYEDAAGGFWRALTMIESARAFSRAQGPAHAREAGVVLGQFHRWLSDLPPARLRDTLPGFHVTPLYLRRYDRTRRRADAKRRLKGSALALKLARFIERRRGFAPVLEAARRRGELLPRLIHGDPKADNILIDRESGKGVCLIDLDTVKPGLIHYDFGDALRSIANPAGEEARELSRVRFDRRLAAAFVRGYLSRARDFLTPADRRYLYDSIRLIAFELGLRFFEDHLAGDLYFKVAEPGQNLKRAAVQFRLCESVEAGEREIRSLL